MSFKIGFAMFGLGNMVWMPWSSAHQLRHISPLYKAPCKQQCTPPFRGGGIEYLNDSDSYVGGCLMLLVGPPKPDRRFDPSFRKVYDKIKSGELGRPRLLKGTSRDHQPPPISYIKTSGGILTDSTVHDLDYSLWLAGSKPERVYVQGMGFDPEIRKYDTDQVLVTIKYKNGVLACIDNGRQAAFGYDQRFEVLCDNGQLRVGNRDRYLMTEDGDHVTAAPRIATHYVYRYSEAYENLLHHFMDVLEGKCEMLITEDEVVTTMRTIQACQESLSTQNPVIFSDDIYT